MFKNWKKEQNAMEFFNQNLVGAPRWRYKCVVQKTDAAWKYKQDF